MSKQEIYLCDIDKCKNTFSYDDEGVNVDFCGYIIFEKNLGGTIQPILQNHEIDICKECSGIMLTGKYIFASHDIYYFKEGK